MSSEEPILITIGPDTFEIAPGFLETLDEIGFVIRTNSRAEVLQQAIALLYLLSRERQEKQVQTFMHYPDGSMRMLQFWKTAARPKLHAVGSDTPARSQPENCSDLDSSFARYYEAMPAFRTAQESVVPPVTKAFQESRSLSCANDDNFG